MKHLARPIFNRYLFADYKSLYYMAGDCKSHAAFNPPLHTYLAALLLSI